MSFCSTKSKGKYQLRHAAGLYWLLDMSQPGVPYQRPLPMNETGAEIWNMLQQGISTTDMVSIICQKYSVLEEDVEQDIQQFSEQLARYNITIE